MKTTPQNPIKFVPPANKHWPIPTLRHVSSGRICVPLYDLPERSTRNAGKKIHVLMWDSDQTDDIEYQSLVVVEGAEEIPVDGIIRRFESISGSGISSVLNVLAFAYMRQGDPVKEFFYQLAYCRMENDAEQFAVELSNLEFGVGVSAYDIRFVFDLEEMKTGRISNDWQGALKIAREITSKPVNAEQVEHFKRLMCGKLSAIDKERYESRYGEQYSPSYMNEHRAAYLAGIPRNPLSHRPTFSLYDKPLNRDQTVSPCEISFPNMMCEGDGLEGRFESR